ncbi:MAG: C10 family peptidase, partial [Prevotellaceae bacterium]|nr:C10 family peptidase [Prevotellaceae bacterium]
MKTFLTSLLLLLATLPLGAEPVTLKQAKAIAASYLKTTDTASLAKRKAAPAATDDETLPIYIFSRGEGEGFVIVSGDTALPSIIGYTDQGDYDEDNLPPALEDMIEYYSSAAEALAQSGTSSTRRNASSSGTKDIATLMTSHWHQSWPYNNLCPYITGTTNRAATGCVATAASQIIYYWRKNLDDRTKYSTPQYSYGDAPATEDDVIPSGTPLKWDLMQDSYSGSDPEECTTAAATLVACVGMSGWLTYGSSTSGQISDQVNVFSSQFGLNGGTCVWHDSYSQSTWEKMIIQDLELGRPILYSGVSSSQGGHAVVIDGYQLSTNLFHFNFGWGAGNGYDGYYTVDGDTGMNGFNETQGMVWNIYPKDNKLTATLSMDGDCLYSRVSNTVTAKVTNNGTLQASGFYLYCLTGTNTPSSASSAQAEETSTVIEPGGSAQLSFTFTPNSTLSYTIYLCDANKNILDRIKDVESIATVADLTLNGLSIDDGGESELVTVDGREIEVKHVFNSKKANVTASFTNGSGGTFCTPSVQGIVYQLSDGEFTQSTTKTVKNVDFAVGATEDMLFNLTSLTDDVVYKFALAGTASTNRSYDITYATADTAVYFKLVGSNLTLTP